MKVKLSTFSNLKKEEKGFTLIELLLYISITILILFSIVFFLSLMQDAKIKNQTIEEVDQQGMQALENMTQALRNASTINFPIVGSSSAISFSVETQDPTKNPTVYDISDGVIRIKEGVGSPIQLTSSNITVSDAVFENITRPGTTGMMRIKFVLTYVSNSERNPYKYTKTFYSSISLR